MSAMCTNAEPLGNRESAHGKLIGVEFLTPPGLGRGCPSVQTSHLTMYYRGFKSRETEKETEIEACRLNTRELSELYRENVCVSETLSVN